MKNKSLLILMLVLFSALTPQLSIRAQGTAFTYQGRLNNGANPANGFYDFQFTLYDDASNPLSGVSITNTLVAMPLSNGLFTVSLDFGDPDSLAIFDGQEIWLGIAVRTNNPGSNYIQLLPRQKFTATPYAITAANLGGTLSSSSFSGTYSSAVTLSNSANHFSGAFTGNGIGVTNLNASQLASGTVPDARLASNVARTNQVWLLNGNAGTAGGGGNFVGTTDNQTLYFKVNGFRALMLVPSGDSAADNTTNDDFTSSVIGGCALNQLGAGVVGATIAGGGAGNFDGVSYVNFVLGDYGAVGGGIGNWASNRFSAVAGGFRNRASGIGAFVGGGGYDSNDFYYIPDLVGNSASGTATTIGGGIGNTASGKYAVVGGGFGNTASGYGSSVGGGGIDGVNLSFGINVFGNTASGIASTIAGGVGNSATDIFATVAGGNRNVANNRGATVSDGQSNIASGIGSFVGGGGVIYGESAGNTASGDAATVCGGFGNTAAGTSSFAAGWGARALHDGSFVWSDGTSGAASSTGPGQFLIKAYGGVGIGTNHPAAPLHVASGGGAQLQITENSSADYARLRMNVIGFPPWEMDVSPGATPGISWWTGTLKMSLDYYGNLITSGTISSSSDRNAKEKFTAVSSRAVLDKVAALPISEWNFKNESAVRHIGPMAQDFYAAFSVGLDDKHIASVDEDGVALAAIQGLNQKLEQDKMALRTELNRKDAEIQQLKQRLDALENILLKQK